MNENFAKGADVGWITEMEAAGIRFYNSSGQQQEGMALLKSLGMNTIRLRAWVNPPDGWNNTKDLLIKAVRAKQLGMRVMIDLHYSDGWADPGKQNKPAAWATSTFPVLKQQLSDYTVSVMIALRDAGVEPEWVQVGNETDDGLLWPDGKASTQMANYAQLIKQGYDAVKSVFPKTKVIVHVSNGWNNGLFRWNIGGLVSNGATFDVIGLSLYPTAANWSVLNNQCLDNMRYLIDTFGKEVMVVEAGMPWDAADACKRFLTDLITRSRAIPNGKCLGVLYWEPLAYGGWKGYTLGAFDPSGRPTEAMEAFSEK